MNGVLAMVLWAMSTWVGFSVSMRYQARPAAIRRLRGALHWMETEIVYGQTELEGIFRHLEAREEGPLAQLFDELASALAAGSRDFAPLYGAALRRWLPKARLGREEQSVLLSLGEVLGKTDRQHQIKHLRLAESALLEIETRAREEEAKYARLSRTFGFLFGLALFILLL
ncbi:MAG: stage III sporulation protein AB [Hydrogenibacillus sp.]|nr:stage III sporulation protein AB [Hydrogenibacillus sp.]